MRNFLYVVAVILVLTTLAIFHLWPADDAIAPTPVSSLTPAQLVARGAYLAKAGDCQACHTARGGVAYAGGRAITTPFGELFAPNLSTDRATGIGAWSADEFWRALHNGKSRDGRLLYPAFPYPDYTRVTRADANALYAYFQSLPAVRQANQPHRLAFPYNQQIALAFWRALFFRPAAFVPQAQRSVEWNLGAYLVQGLGHCAACHSSRNALGAHDELLAGALMPGAAWYAPSLNLRSGMPGHATGQLVQLLKTGVVPSGAVFGPMAGVVRDSLQHLTDADLQAMVVYLQNLEGEAEHHVAQPSAAPDQTVMATGAKLYQTHCLTCHQADGRGLPPGYPPLAGNRALATDPPVNLIRMVLNGGFAPGTAGNPRPYGMPPFAHVLGDADVAALATYLANSWGDHGPSVSPAQVNRYRGVPDD